MAASTLLQVVNAFYVGDDEYTVGEIIEADDPIAKSHAANLGPLKVKERRSAPKVEKATAAPGEKRS